MKWGHHFDKESLEKRFQELELQMQEKGFWDDIKRAEDVTKESKSIKDKIKILKLYYLKIFVISKIFSNFKY